ncbi:MAG: Sua5/YciO/YrdC/YwlC family protein, partial [Leptospirales bacterium]
MVHLFSSGERSELINKASIAAARLKQKKIIALSTDTIYGLAGIFEPSVIARIHKVKKRDLAKPFILALPENENFLQFIDESKPDAQRLYFIKQKVDQGWPGKISFIFAKNPNLPYPPGDTIGLRIPKKEDNLFFYTVLQQTGPLVIPSLNKAGSEPLFELKQIEETFGA